MTTNKFDYDMTLFEDFEIEELLPDGSFESDIPALLLTRKYKEGVVYEDA